MDSKVIKSRDYAIEKQIKDSYTDRISLAICRETFHAKEKGLTDEDVLLVRDFLYSLAVVDYSCHERKAKQEAKVIKLNTTDYDNAKESNFILPSKHRRAS